MSATGLGVFDRSLQITNIWLDEIVEKLGPDRQFAWKVLSTVLHKLRDHLPVDVAAHLGAQLPLIIRGVYYDQFQPARQPVGYDTAEAFLEDVGKWLADARHVGPGDAVATVFGLLSRHISEGEIEKVRQALPKGIRALWAVAEEPVG